MDSENDTSRGLRMRRSHQARPPAPPTDAAAGAVLPNLDDFEQQVSQADLDRDPFAIALFEVKPAGNDYSDLLDRLARCLLDFASPSTHVAHLGSGRLAVITRTTDVTHQWVAPIGTALQATVEGWLGDGNGHSRTGDRGGDRPLQMADLVESIGAPELVEQPRLISGAARGITQQVWVNAEAALAKAHKRQLSFVEHRGQDVRSPTGDCQPLSHDGRTRSEAAEISGGLAAVDHDDRLIVLARRLEPVNRPEPEWHWLRLESGIQPVADEGFHRINPTTLIAAERAMLEVWLANQVGPLFDGATAQLRVTIPLTAEAGRARSFAQRIFPILERHRIPPSRLVLEIDSDAVLADPAPVHGESVNGSQPSVRRFIEDAGSMDVSVVASGFHGGWISWQAIQDLPIGYIKPLADIVTAATVGDDVARRSLDLMATEADNRGIELIVPDVETELAPQVLADLGFAYQEGSIASIERSLAPSGKSRSAAADQTR